MVWVLKRDTYKHASSEVCQWVVDPTTPQAFALSGCTFGGEVQCICAHGGCHNQNAEMINNSWRHSNENKLQLRPAPTQRTYTPSTRALQGAWGAGWGG